MSQLANRITFHHTAGYYQANNIEKEAYHYLIDNKGNVSKGFHSIADNVDCTDGNYAKHCGGGNTKNIGIAFCANVGFKESTLFTTQPLTRAQLEAGFRLAAEACIKYKINVTSDTVFTHYEFDRKKHKPEGKIDIIYMPPFPSIKRADIGNCIRSKVLWYIQHWDGKFKYL